MWQQLISSSSSSLRRRVVMLFAAGAVIPAVVVTVFSVLFFNLGLTSWFETKVNTALQESVAVAEAYLEEHKEVLRADARAIANDINRESFRLMSSPRLFHQFVSGQAAFRSLAEAVVFQRGRVLARSSLSFSLAYEQLPPEVFERANYGEIVILTSEDEDRVRALVRLERFTDDTYLLAERLVDPRVIHHMEATHGAVAEYESLRERISSLQVRFSIFFSVLVVLLLITAVWYGTRFVSKLLRPIDHLFRASERVRAGDYTVRVPVPKRGDEMTEFSRAFNKMAGQLDSQRSELMEANRQLDARRRFSEAVLAGVSAGVMALDGNRCITLCNRSAVQLLDVEWQDIRGSFLADVVPEMSKLLERSASKEKPLVQDDINIERGDRHLNLHVRIDAEVRDGDVLGFVVTFDDITQLVQAQRSAAWAGVARRIAHEIKNPLTPIQLSAERLKKKYLPQISEDPDTFTKYADNIVRHVGNIGQMVEEFVSFARMPMPVFAEEELIKLLRDVVFSEQQVHSSIHYDVQTPKPPLMISCDHGQLSRAITNILKNSAESLEEKEEISPENGEIHVLVEEESGRCIITIEDNGPGFPKELLGQLTEPYVTTRSKGTGLGLAIVQKIIEDHEGELVLSNREESGGARVRISLPLLLIPRT